MKEAKTHLEVLLRCDCLPLGCGKNSVLLIPFPLHADEDTNLKETQKPRFRRNRQFDLAASQTSAAVSGAQSASEKLREFPLCSHG